MRSRTLKAMTSDRADIRARRPTYAGMLACLASAVLLIASGAWAQQAPPPPAPNSPPAQTKVQEPGLFESLGRWFDEGAANFRAHMRGAKDRFDDLGDKAANARKTFGDTAAEVGKSAADATKTAVDAVAKLPNARVVQGRQTCALAPNGAPDCQTAAETLCRSQGYATGKSIDFTSAEKCPPRAWLSGRRGNEAECTTETFISRAMCQ
jgi:hypothetical protein